MVALQHPALLLRQAEALALAHQGIDAAKLDLTPKSEKIRQHFAHIFLWIDPQKGLSVKQQLFETSGDYRIAKYSGIQVNQKIPEDKFKLKTSGKTKTLTH